MTSNLISHYLERITQLGGGKGLECELSFDLLPMTSTSLNKARHWFKVICMRTQLEGMISLIPLALAFTLFSPANMIGMYVLQISTYKLEVLPIPL